MQLVSTLIAAIGLAVGCSSIAQAQLPSPAPRESATVGAGFPEGKAFDILGITTGMPGEAAIRILKTHPAQARQPREISPINPDLVIWMSPQTSADADAADKVHVGWTVSTTRQEVVSVLRFMTYPKDRPADLRTTLGEIRQKYGVPTWIDLSDGSAALYYSIANGTILEAAGDTVPCFRSFTAMTSAPSDARSAAYAAAMSSAAGRNRFEPTPCQAILYVKLTFANDPVSGTVRKDAIGHMDMRLLDMKRQRDLQQ